MAHQDKATIDAYFQKIRDKFAAVKNDDKLFNIIVNEPFCEKKLTTNIGLGVAVLLLVNKKTKSIDRIALSDTEAAKGAVEYSVKPFKEIKIPEHYPKNIIAQAIDTGEYRQTADWKDMFMPALTPQEARFNQAGAGIGCSVVYPLVGARDGGAMIFSFYIPPEDIKDCHHDFMRRYRNVVVEALRG